KCAEAFQWYKQIFGGELRMMTNAEVPEGTDPMPGASPDDVLHASINLGNGFLMGSDDPTGDGGRKLGVAVAFAAPDEKEGKRVFEALSEGGEVQMPYQPTFFSKGFGMCVDRYGL